VTKPRGYMQAAEEQLFCWLVLCLPYWQTLLFAGISGMISFLLLTVLLLFVVTRSPAIYRTIIERLKAFPTSWIAPILDRKELWITSHLLVLDPGPSPAPSFQRPPPLFS
jgi:hypothetical protein